MRQCVAGRESNFSMVTGVEAKDECRLALDALKQSPLYNCRCKRGMKKEKNCLRIYWGIYQHLQGNDLLEDSPYEPVNSRLSDIFRLAPIYSDGSEEYSSVANAQALVVKKIQLSDLFNKRYLSVIKQDRTKIDIVFLSI
ncbi:hypothetical protein cypCar_00023918 [Cyprinus carpio]|nr:hypothetical protein cypCar_00023918 [Cyprinus carpio]